MANQREELGVSVLTSCLNHDIRSFLEEMGSQNISNIDLYCFGDQDLDRIAPDWAEKGVTKTIAELPMEQLEAATKGVIKQYESDNSREVNVVAVATYMPDLSSHDLEKQDVCIEALRKMVELCARLESNYLELVVGTKYTSRTRDDVVNVDRYKRREKQQRIFESLTKVAKLAFEKHVHLCLEFEPGAGYILNSAEEGLKLFDMLKQMDSDLYSTVGLNIDIGHMLIMDIKPHVLAPVQDKIYHSHISGNANSHFADLIPGTFHTLSTKAEGNCFSCWLAFLRRLCATSKHFSGWTAIELEASDNREWVFSAHRRVTHLISRL